MLCVACRFKKELKKKKIPLEEYTLSGGMHIWLVLW